MIFTTRFSQMMMLFGFMSAWMYPRVCMWARASAVWWKRSSRQLEVLPWRLGVYADPIHELHHEKDRREAHQRPLLLDAAHDLADVGVVQFLRDPRLGDRLVQEPSVLVLVLLDVLERPDLLGLGILHEIDDRGRTGPHHLHDPVSSTRSPCLYSVTGKRHESTNVAVLLPLIPAVPTKHRKTGTRDSIRCVLAPVCS